MAGNTCELFDAALCKMYRIFIMFYRFYFIYQINWNQDPYFNLCLKVLMILVVFLPVVSRCCFLGITFDKETLKFAEIILIFTSKLVTQFNYIVSYNIPMHNFQIFV